MYWKVVGYVLALVVLAGCKAESIQIRLSASDIDKALSGEAVSVPFKAQYRNFGDLKDDDRAKLDDLEKIARQYLAIDDFDVSSNDNSVMVEVDGTIPVVTAANKGASPVSPWVISVEDSAEGIDQFPLRVSIVSTSDFNAMSDKMEDVSFMSNPDEFNPVQFRLKGSSASDLKVLAGGFQMDGDNYSLKVVAIPAGESATLNFSGGAYDGTAASFLLSGLK